MADSMPTEQCTIVARQEMCVDADVTVVPSIHAGPATTRCVGGIDLRDCFGWDERQGSGAGEDGCDRHHPGECGFSVRQVICVSFPLTFTASVDAAVSGVECRPAKPGPFNAA